MGNNNEAEKTTQTAPKDGPYIDAGDMSLKEFKEWLGSKRSGAFAYDDYYPSHIDDVCACLRRLTEKLEPVIEALQDPEIVRSADHASEAQRDILFYQAIQKASTNFLTSIAQLKADPQRKWWRDGQPAVPM
ncbi:hypothetical protein GXR14_001253 [Salmonella enterica]|nr:hypothetical protein [Salmonella enterica]EHC5874024.1 hypothetical protein [Salmonella enterica subsp. enterica serovar Eastbourne]EHC5910761.1 hypothetical protein [Salmonella enterica subsp. enterica serovar Eastbourne]EMB5319282.1 hypothetical protein [Salmonella enterica]